MSKKILEWKENPQTKHEDDFIAGEELRLRPMIGTYVQRAERESSEICPTHCDTGHKLVRVNHDIHNCCQAFGS